ncbi:MAG: sensor histidine kinase [Ilumatobacter sp.]
MTEPVTPPTQALMRSVRARVTLVVSLLSAITFAAVAAFTPGFVGNGLEDDLLDAEASNAFAFTQVVSIDSGGSAVEFILDADGEPFEVQSGTVLTVQSEPTMIEEALEEFGLDPDVDDLGEVAQLDDFGVDASDMLSIAAVGQITADRIDLLESVGAFDALIDAAGGPFGTDIDPFTLAIIDEAGTIEIVQGDVASLGVPIMTEFELDEYIFDDLGIFAVESGSLVDVDTDARIALGVREIDGLALLVAADASTVDRSVSGIRTGLWLAAGALTLAIAAMAWMVTSRALRPVRSITDQAATITSGSLDARVPVPASGDEIATLAETVNEMLDRLEVDDRTRRRFISDASHELRSPVAVMRNEAEVALHHPGATDIGQLAATVADESKRMATIIDDLLALARHDEGVAAPTTEIDLDDIVIQEAARARRVPIDVTAVSAGRIAGRSDEFARMVGHLLDNAARHADATVAVSLGTVADAVELWVDDDGPGVAPDDRDRIFDRFARLDDARSRDQGGAGLGLAVVHGIVERSGGTIAVSDSPLGGARFTARFSA